MKNQYIRNNRMQPSQIYTRKCPIRIKVSTHIIFWIKQLIDYYTLLISSNFCLKTENPTHPNIILFWLLEKSSYCYDNMFQLYTK